MLAHTHFRPAGAIAQRGCFARAVAALAFASVLSAVPSVRADGGKADVRVSQQGPMFVVEAPFEAPVPLALAWEVLTDFEQMDQFVPNLADSHIVARAGPRLTIPQHGVAKFGPLSYRFESERLVTLIPPASVRSVQTRGTMTKLESLTSFVASGEGTRLDYRAEVIPGALFPDAITRRFLSHEIVEQFEAIVREMVRRRDAQRR